MKHLAVLLAVLLAGCAGSPEAPTQAPAQPTNAPTSTPDPLAAEQHMIDRWNSAIDEAGAKLVEAEDNPTIDMEGVYQVLKDIQSEAENLDPQSRCWNNALNAIASGVNAFKEFVFTGNDSYGRSLLDDMRDYFDRYQTCAESNF